MTPHIRVMSIRDLATATGVPAPTIRYYEEIGLLPVAWRSDSGQRRYQPDDVARLTFIRRCRDFGFPIDKVRVLASLSTSDTAGCQDARDITADHLRQVRDRIADLQTFEATLQGFVDQCDAVCRDGAGRDCIVFSAMQGADPPIPDLRG